MKIFLTGHTGFKGSWFSIFLRSMGHEVTGFALDPVAGSLFDLANVSHYLVGDIRGDITNRKLLEDSIASSGAEAVIHFAAQALVSEGWQNPVETFHTNVTGTMNVVTASALSQGLPCLVVTTDKVYQKPKVRKAMLETDPLGGSDPYSISKAIADQASTQLGKSGIAPGKIVVLRAGNVLGGGDNSDNRIVKDALEAHENGSALMLRNPDHVRPWQHVLDCLAGYYRVLQKIDSLQNGDAYNFGPSLEKERTVLDLAKAISEKLPGNLAISSSAEISIGVEDDHLSLDSSKARRELDWQPQFSFEEMLSQTVEWHLTKNKEEACVRQVKGYIQGANFS